MTEASRKIQATLWREETGAGRNRNIEERVDTNRNGIRKMSGDGGDGMGGVVGEAGGRLKVLLDKKRAKSNSANVNEFNEKIGGPYHQ